MKGHMFMFENNPVLDLELPAIPHMLFDRKGCNLTQPNTNVPTVSIL